MLAVRAGGSVDGRASPGGNEIETDEDDDVPMWSSIAHNKEVSQPEPLVEKVLGIIPGTLVNPPE
jgi:hypothetical protein